MGSNCDLLVKNGLIVYSDKTIRGNLVVSNGVVEKILPPTEEVECREVLNAEGRYILPGIIDPHTHPVYLDNISDLSKTGAFGGVTTVVHYAYAKPGNSLLKVVREYKKEGESTSYTDFALHGTMFDTRQQVKELPQVFNEGVTSFKMFMSYAKLGWMTDDYALAMALDTIGKLGGMASLHAENGLVIDYIQDEMLKNGEDFREHFVKSSPDILEAEAIFRAVYVGRLMNCPVYIPHISSREGIEVIRYLKERGFRVYAETCPHYLALTWDKLKAKGPLGKVGPSIKTENDRLALWDAIKDGLIDTIGSDHAPKEKSENDEFFKAPYGAPGIETMFYILWQYGVNGGVIPVNRLVSIFSENASRILGLYPKKGVLLEGSDADFIVFNPFKEWTIERGNQHSNATYTLYEETKITGRIEKVFLRGRLIVDGNECLGKPGDGGFLKTRAGASI